MEAHGDNRIDSRDRGQPRADPAPRRAAASFPGTDSDQWHRTLTGRQSPEPMGAKLRMIYGNIVAERLPDHLLDLLHELDRKQPK